MNQPQQIFNIPNWKTREDMIAPPFKEDVTYEGIVELLIEGQTAKGEPKLILEALYYDKTGECKKYKNDIPLHEKMSHFTASFFDSMGMSKEYDEKRIILSECINKHFQCTFKTKSYTTKDGKAAKASNINKFIPQSEHIYILPKPTDPVPNTLHNDFNDDISF